jgi:hypothetical protein
MNQPAMALIVSVHVMLVPALALVYRVLVHVQVEEDAKNEFPEKT